MGRGPEETFLQRRYINGQQVHEKVLNITNHQGNANKTVMIHHITPVRMVIIKQTRDKCWRRCGEKGNLVHSWWACKLPLCKARTVSINGSDCAGVT